MRLFDGVGRGAIELLQPPHWVAETLAVVVRQRPDRVEEVADTLLDMDVEHPAAFNTWIRAARIADRLNHHLFDTLYHAMAMQHGATFVTADERYFAKAHALGGIELLSAFRFGDP